MLIQRLKVSNVRNIAHADLIIEERLVVISGINGAGKSSLVEALSIISTGRSFRTNSINKVISNHAKNLSVFVSGLKENASFQAGVLRESNGQYRAKLNGESILRQYELSNILPIFVIIPGFYEQVAGQRKNRMKLLDWGVFHVEHQFFNLWREFTKVLKQRNALLKQIKIGKQTLSALNYWDDQFCLLAENLTLSRSNYVKKLNEYFKNLSLDFTDLLEGTHLDYRPGNPKDKSLDKALISSRESDVHKGFTQYGPHRADFKVVNEGKDVFEFTSRGQQKLLINGLMLSIIQLFSEETSKECLICIDDLPSELDEERQAKLVDALMSLDCAQVLLTAITEDSLKRAVSGYNRQMFHVEHGQFQVQKDLKQ